ncbi:helix-turn-helix domain-containing protein [Pseudomonas sp. ABC1]|uniref:RodZ domain-containing protein n=1 Tax=Pseudomonas sp. ABC1 TaxID=2748080 RepID=UPI0015C332E5|nr:RodZ family helix-turn-helix domain-containing protein [Pseudomonas sp. ABC1]QLF94620.1 helix-turn-helix domain-containing protein [Pseudomonas sp. ABC1]
MSASYPESPSSVSANPGETLRLARESKGLSLATVALQLNLPVKTLQQIESGDFSRLPSATFARGYVRSYAKFLELDQNRLVHEFDVHTGSGAASSTVHSLERIDEPSGVARSVLRLFSISLLLVLLVTAFYWWQEQADGDAIGNLSSAFERIEVESVDGTTEIHVLDPSEIATPDEPGIADVEIAQTTTGDETPPSENVEPAPSVPAADTTPTDAAPAPQAAPTAPAPVEQPLAAGEGRIELSFSGDCWIQLTDADGKVLLSTLAKAGSSQVLTGKAPISIHLGRASAVQVRYNGEPVDLAPHMRGEIARFKLGQ